MCFIDLLLQNPGTLGIVKNSSKQVNNTNFGFLTVTLTYVHAVARAPR